MKRDFLKVAAVLSLVMLVGCGKKADSSGDDPAPKTQAKKKAGGDTADESSQSGAGKSAKPQAGAGLSGPCASITLDPAHEAMFSIDKVTKDQSECNVVIEAKVAIKFLSFDWKYLDKEGVKVGTDSETLKGLAAGDKAKLTIAPDEGATRIVSTPRAKAASRRKKPSGSAEATEDTSATLALCKAIKLDPAQAAMFSIGKVSVSDGFCELVVEAKTAIGAHVRFYWKTYDKDDVLLASKPEFLSNLAPGDKAKVSFSPDEGTTRIVSSSTR